MSYNKFIYCLIDMHNIILTGTNVIYCLIDLVELICLASLHNFLVYRMTRNVWYCLGSI